jgi:general secretion pathway protein D
VSSLSGLSVAASDLITNERKLQTKVLAVDGQVVVLGGLIEETLNEDMQKVPLLGDIPLLGNLFRSRKTEKVKTNLMIFIRPTILRDTATIATETNQKYNMMRDVMRASESSDIALMPGENRFTLPPIEEVRENEPQEGERQ